MCVRVINVTYYGNEFQLAGRNNEFFNIVIVV